MKKVISIFRASLWLRICTVTAIGLIIASFLVPPMGVIDSSVLAATGEIFGFASLWLVYIGLEKGIDTTIKKGTTEITLNNKEEEEKKK